MGDMTLFEAKEDPENWGDVSNGSGDNFIFVGKFYNITCPCARGMETWNLWQVQIVQK